MVIGASQRQGEVSMIELISIIASLAVCILTPFEVRRIRRGWVHKKFAGDQAKYLAAYRKQLTLLIVVGIVFGVLGIGLAFIETKPGEMTVKIIAAVIWFAVAVICFISRRMLPSGPTAAPLSGTRA
jgi:hypothetical protein